MEKLTRAQAIERGYTHACGEFNDTHFYPIQIISDEELSKEDYRLAKREPDDRFENGELNRLLISWMDNEMQNSEWYREVAFDIKAMDFSDVTKRLNEMLAKHPIFKPTEIILEK